jgi:hypothetical protein
MWGAGPPGEVRASQFFERAVLSNIAAIKRLGSIYRRGRSPHYHAYPEEGARSLFTPRLSECPLLGVKRTFS